MRHAQQSLVLTSISAVDIIRHVAIRVLLKRLHSDPSEQHNERGVTCTSARTHTHSGFWCSSPTPLPCSSLYHFAVLLKVSPELGGNASHTLICLYRDTQCSQPSQSSRVGNKAGSVCDKGWMLFMYIRTSCVGGERDRCSCVCKKRGGGRVSVAVCTCEKQSKHSRDGLRLCGSATRDRLS